MRLFHFPHTRTWTLIWFNILRHDYIPEDENKWSSALDKNFVLTRQKKLLVFFTSTKSEDGTFPAGITYTRVIKFRTREEWQKITSERKYGIMSFSSFFAFLSLARLSFYESSLFPRCRFFPHCLPVLLIFRGGSLSSYNDNKTKSETNLSLWFQRCLR